MGALCAVPRGALIRQWYNNRPGGASADRNAARLTTVFISCPASSFDRDQDAPSGVEGRGEPSTGEELDDVR